MKEYIDRNAVVAQITKLINESGKYTNYECGADDACFVVTHAPAADVRPVVKAVWKHVKWVVDEEWQDGGYWISRCSNCLIPYNEETPFCPHCGADMRPEEVE